MALATRCPGCSTVFRIGTAQAAAKGGMVRCGHCRNVFNSLDALVRVEDLDILDESSVASHGTARSSNGDASPDGFRPTEIAHEPGRRVEDAIDDARIQEWWMPARSTGGAKSVAPSRSTTVPAVDGSDVAAATATAIATVAPTSAHREPPQSDVDIPWSPALGATGSVFMPYPGADEPSRARAFWVWGSLCLATILVLAGQLAYLWRDEIGVRWAPARPWLVSACSVLGCTVDYPARSDAVTIESASVQISGTNAGAGPAPSVYVLTALLRNRDNADVRYPFLELTLTDTNDKPVLRRVLRPEDYLAAPHDGGGRVGPAFVAQSELPIRVTFELNNLRFAGYRLDHFYP